MNSEQRAIIALAEKEGTSPIEKDARLIVHGMVNATRAQMRKYQVGYDKMGQDQQDAVIGDLTAAYEELAITIARALASASTPAVIMTCKDLKVSNGTFTAIVESDQDHYNDLISKVQDKGEIVAVLYERQFRDAMETIQGDKDQRTLSLDDASDSKQKAKRAPKAKVEPEIEIPEGLLNQARDFVIIQQNATFAGIQNQLKIGMQKAEAILKLLEGEGVVRYVGDDKTGQYELVRSAPVVTGEQGEKVEIDAETAEVFYQTACKAVLKAVSADDSVLRPIYGDDDNAIEQALMRMEEDGIVSAPSPEGLRDVLTIPN